MGASVRVRTIEWAVVIGDIRREGLMVKAIARKVGMSPQGLHAIYCGATKEPCYSVGARLLELREKVAR